MAKTYSLDLRERILKDDDAGVPVEILFEQYYVSRSWLYSLIRQRRETGSIAPCAYRSGRKQKLAPYEQKLRQLVAEHSDATLVEYVGQIYRHIKLPPYSSDFNPMENVFSKLKTLVRKLKIRKVEDLWRGLGELCDVFSPEECLNYFRHAGYQQNINVQTNS